MSNKRMELSPVVLESEGVCGLEFKGSTGLSLGRGLGFWTRGSEGGGDLGPDTWALTLHYSCT